MDKHFKRILNLVRRTGDRMVVTDPTGDDAYVVMGLDAYEELIEAQEFSADLAAEQEVQKASASDTPPFPSEDDVPQETTLEEQTQHDLRVWEAMRPAGVQGETWDMAKLTEGEKLEVEQAYQDLKIRREDAKTSAPTSPKPQTVESQVLAEEDEPGEEQFYLEPVE